MSERGARSREGRLVIAVLAAFFVFAIYTGARSPFGPGVDFHYHVMSAAITARRWAGDPFFTRLYRVVSPLDSNTLLYTLVAPLQAFLSPLRAFSAGFTLEYFVGYPLACVAALKLLRRPLWGAVLAFPLSYVKSWSQFGYMPFVSAAPFYVLAIGAMHRVLEERTPAGEPPPRHNVDLLAALACMLAFLAHAHVYAWLMFVLGVITLGTLLVRLGRDVLVLPREALRAFARLSAHAMAVAFPSLMLFAVWYVGTRRAGAPFAPSHSTIESKLTAVLPFLVQAGGDADWGFVAALLVLLLALFLFAPRAPGVPTPEFALLLSLGAFLFLPWNVTGQSIAPRHIDLAFWLVPLLAYPAAPRSGARRGALVSAIVLYAVLRTGYVAGKLHELQHEMSGLLVLARQCPAPDKELAAVTFASASSAFPSTPMAQAHETFAALCHLDTPVYDTSTFPHSLAPVRYRGAPPAPPTILSNQHRWFANAAIAAFDYVLVYAWVPSAGDLRDAQAVADPIASAGAWQLWRRHPVP